VESVASVINRGTKTAGVLLEPNSDIVLTLANNPTTGNSPIQIFITYISHMI